MRQIPIFPLGLVAYPTEKLNLHIFEPKYKQLVHECIDENRTFGIPPYQEGKDFNICTEMRILEIEKTYDDGRMDVRTYGLGLCKIHDVENPVKGKLYAGATVSKIDNDMNGDMILSQKIIVLLERLFVAMNIEYPLPDSIHFHVYDIAHKAGLNFKQEIEILELTNEIDRQEYLQRHLHTMVPMVLEMENMRRKIQMNGHFKNVIPPQF